MSACHCILSNWNENPINFLVVFFKPSIGAKLLIFCSAICYAVKRCDIILTIQKYCTCCAQLRTSLMFLLRTDIFWLSRPIMDPEKLTLVQAAQLRDFEVHEFVWHSYRSLSLKISSIRLSVWLRRCWGCCWVEKNSDVWVRRVMLHVVKHRTSTFTESQRTFEVWCAPRQ